MDLRLDQEYWSNGIVHLAGVDEAGRGPLAGPVVAAAVVFPVNEWISGVDDSKRLSALRRETLATQIRNRAVSVGVGIVHHDEIDRINILNATMLAMSQALDALGIVPGFVLVDGNRFTDRRFPSATIVDGDARSFTIAAASIIAKTTRDAMMREFAERYPVYGFDRHKGYGTQEHLRAIRKHGMCDIHRKSFRIRHE